MIQVVTWPPIHYCSYSLLGRHFEQEVDEPFLTSMRDGSVDTDLTRQSPGFVNRIQRFGLQNNIDRAQWDEQKIYFAILQRLPLPLRGKFFRNRESNSQPLTLSPVNVHTAPVPSGLAKAAGLESVAEADQPAALAALAPDKWNHTLQRWLALDPARRTRTAAGPAWWWALHSVSLNPNPSSSPGRFIGVWIGRFPCRQCRMDSRKYFAKHPFPTWENFPAWANEFHNFVTARKH